MPAHKSRAALSQLVEPLSDDELDQTAQTVDNTMDSAIENLDPVPSSRMKASSRTKSSKATTSKTAPASKVTKPRATTRRTSSTAATSNSRKTAKGSKRSALAERTDPNASETEEVEEFEDEAPPKRKARRHVEDETMDEETEVQIKPTKKDRARPTKAATASRSKTSKRAPSAEPARIIPETQPDPDSMDMAPSTVEEVTELPLEPKRRPRVEDRARPTSKQREPSVTRNRAGSVSDPERRAHDPQLRRKLGDITKKFENLDIKYRQLKEIGLRDSESNFEKLRKSSEQRARDQDGIIASQKKEIAILRASQTDTKPFRTKISSLESENQKVAADSSRMSSELKAVNSSLTDAQNEVKSLTAKLAAAREAQKAAEEAAKAAVAAAKAPASASKTNAAKNAAGALTTDMTNLKLKEELYSDLTGLMVRNVKKIEGEDVFDCIQTGRNGSKCSPTSSFHLCKRELANSFAALHFHLSIPPPPSNADGNGNAFDDMEFAYTPLLDEKNDRELLEILPDYLTEEICFPRSSAAKFYAKVLDCMSKKVVVESDE